MLQNKNFSVACLSAVLLTVASEAAFTKSFNHMQAQDVYHMPNGKMSMSQVLTPPHSTTLSQIQEDSSGARRPRERKNRKQKSFSGTELEPAIHGEMEAPRCPGRTDEAEVKTVESLAQKKRKAMAAIKASEVDPSECTVTMNRSQQNQTNLAQIQSSLKTCTSAIDQRKEQLPDFASIVTQSQDWLDSSFGQVKDSMYWDGVDPWIQNTADMYYAERRITWKKATTLEGAKLWGTSGQLANMDVNQGEIGNCYFLAAAAAIAEKPERIQNIFLNQSNDLNAAGIYGVNLYTLGVPHTVIVDDYLPLEDYWGNGNWSTIFSKIGQDKAMWMPILEKAFAKLNGNYSHTIAGDMATAAEQILGGMTRKTDHKMGEGGLSESEKTDLWEQMLAHNGKDGMMWASTPGSGDDSQANAEDLYNSHAYVVQHVQETSWGLKMVRIRNPHGKDNYKGKYSDHESRAGDWTQELRDELDYQVSSMDDGVIHMEWDYYLANITQTQLGEDTTGWYTSSYLKMDDNSLDTDSSKTSRLSWCSGCTRHVMKIKSTVDQKVYLSANTWPRRFYPQSNECLPRGSNYASDPNNPYSYFGWGNGQADLPVIEMTAGQEVEVVMEMDFMNSTKKDWSLVSWSESGAVEITNSDGTASETLPFIARSTDGGDNSNTDGGDNSNTDGGDNSNTDGGDNSNTDGGDNSNTDGGDNSNTDGGDNSNTDGGDNSGTDGGDNSGTDGGDNSGTDGGDNSGTDGGDNSGTDVWEPTQEQLRFNTKVERYQPGTQVQCSAGLKESLDVKTDAWFASLYNGCHEIGWNLLFTVIINTDEYEGWVMTYETEDKVSDFQCEQYDDEQTECTIEVGSIQDWQSKGLKGELNDWAGFLTRPGDWGVNSYSTEWVQV